MFVLPVGFSVITNDPVGVGNWGSLSVCWSNFSVEGVVKSLEKTVLQVHISDWVDTIWEWNTSWNLSISSSPLVLDTFHMPLIDNNNNFLMRRLINLLKKIIISFFNKDFFELWEENIHWLNIPVDQVWIKTLFRELMWLSIVKSIDGLNSFVLPESLSLHLHSSPDVTWEIHSGFMIESRPSFLIKFWSKELKLGSLLLSLFTSKFDFKTRLQESKAWWDLKVVLKHSCVRVESEPEDGSSSWMPHVEGLHLSIFIKILIIMSELSLWINILKHLSGIPPLLISLNQDGFRFNFLNKFLSSLSKHSWLICRADKIDLFIVESLS